MIIIRDNINHINQERKAIYQELLEQKKNGFIVLRSTMELIYCDDEEFSPVNPCSNPTLKGDQHD